MPPLPQISAKELSQKFDEKLDFILMDVREPYELEYAKLNDAWITLVPLSQLAREGAAALPENCQNQDAEIIVMCHTGQRSQQVTAWLLHHGWKNVRNLTGGIDAYARQIDPTVGFY